MLPGELLLRKDISNQAEAQRCFERVLDILRASKARNRGNCARRRASRGCSTHKVAAMKRATLAEIYNWFTEGFDTADLKDSKASLDELGT
jgi:hypothetical protein